MKTQKQQQEQEQEYKPMQIRTRKFNDILKSLGCRWDGEFWLVPVQYYEYVCDLNKAKI